MFNNAAKNLNDVFDVEDLNQFDSKPNAVAVVETQETLPVTKDSNEEIIKDADSDYQLARQNLRNLIERGEELLDGALHLASFSEDPKALSAANEILRSLGGLNSDLLKLSKQKQSIHNSAASIEKKEQPQQVTNVQNNVVFSGTSSELLKLIKSNLYDEKTTA